jgi:hypothetical protein
LQPRQQGFLQRRYEEFAMLGRAEVVIGKLLEKRKLFAAMSARHRA